MTQSANLIDKEFYLYNSKDVIMKKTERLRLTLIMIVLALLTVVCASGGDSSSEKDPITAIISELSGKVQVLKPAVGEFTQAELATFLEVNDQVLTGDDGRVKIDLSDGTIIRLSPLSNFVLRQIETTDQGTLTRLQLNIGRLWIILNGGELYVDTPSGVASVRGSYLHVWVDPIKEFTNITCLEGICSLENNGRTVSLVAGETADVEGLGADPNAGHMSHTDVAEWLNAHPNSTQVVVPLTETVAARQGAPLPEALDNTPTPTATTGPSATPSMTSTPTYTLMAVDCGPPLGWVLHTVRTGETLESLSALYRVSVADLQDANCRGTMTFIVPGEKLYVPNVATSTPTFTPTPTITKTPTPLASSTTTGGSGSGATATATNSPTTLSGPVGPDREIISDASLCPNAYKIKAVDADGIAEVKLIYTFDNSLPMRDSAVSAGRYILLPLISSDVYGVSGRVIDTTGQAAPVTIKFRFAALDKRGNLTYFPATSAYTLTDQVNCSSAASFSNESGPSGTTITNAANCQWTFQIDATDPDGIAEAKLLYNVNNNTPSWSTSVAAGEYYTMSKTGTNTYSVTTVIDSSVGTTDVVKYVYAIKDGLGNIYHYPKTGDFVYTDSVDCGKTTWNSVVSPDGKTLSTGQCTQDYSVNVLDANGISKVEVAYVISGDQTNLSGKFALPLTTGSTYAKSHLIDSTAGVFTPPYTVNFEFKATDQLGHQTSLFSGQFTGNVSCP